MCEGAPRAAEPPAPATRLRQAAFSPPSGGRGGSLCNRQRLFTGNNLPPVAFGDVAPNGGDCTVQAVTFCRDM